LPNHRSPSGPPSVSERIEARLLDLFFQQATLPVLVQGVLVLVLGALLWPHVPHGALLAWGGTMVAALGACGAMILHRRWHPERPLAHWILWVRATASAAGLAWGALALLYPLLDCAPHQLLIVITLLSVPSGMVAVLARRQEAAQAFGGGCLLPLAVVLALQPDAGYRWLALSVLLYLVMVPLLMPRGVQASIWQVHADALARDAVLQRLEAAEAVAGVGHFVWGHGSPEIQASAQLRHMLGLPAQGVLRRADLWRGLAPAEIRRLRAAVHTAYVARQETFAYEVALQGRGAVTDLYVVHRVQYDGEGRVVHGLTTVQDISARKADQRELQALAFHDPLTGLVNRNRFQERLASSVDGADADAAVALLMLDLDHFKSVNDTLGHAVGDRLLVAAAERLRACVRPVDTVARLGGDEFAIIAPVPESGIVAAELAAAVIQSLSRPFQLDGQEVYVSSSIGIALFPEDARGADLLLRCADMALFEAKAQGRACFQFHTPEQGEQARERVALEADLRRALERGEFELHFQPKIDMPTRRVIGAEALLRWHHRERGMVPPDVFIGIAEDSGLIVPIGDWVLRQACAAAAAWNAGRPAHEALKIAVNLSPRQFWAPNLLTMVCEAMVHTGCRPEWIELEITESLLLDSRGQVGEVLANLREMGFTLAIDDFGTGYSALGYLTRFPIGTLKIDRAFVSGVAGDRQREAIVRAIVSMGHSLQLTLVAEGVETTAQAEVLQTLGCRLAQGWLYGRPVTREAFEQQHLRAALEAPVAR
jgi:diguanylate cyclase (GGDEF)-like protein